MFVKLLHEKVITEPSLAEKTQFKKKITSSIIATVLLVHRYNSLNGSSLI